ncbi:MAG: peptidoglycan-associated lipoprotein Pal [Desulfovibrionaceae bacterium]|nr:peptidoglycan-associated lipoprotein Pal [Deltaproteobacteria bacterium]MBR5734311.1 peptidoglycan-associated lipoprotein Pal [Desulfovibrionaceae bacterium]
MNMFKKLSLVLALVLALGIGAGCSKKVTDPDAAVSASDTDSATAAAIDSAAQTISDGVVYFDFDKYNIKEEYRAMLAQKADLMKEYPSIRVRIEGNCDARGTQEYNLALGERRARAAYDYMVRLGVNPSQLDIISYGKERPAVPGSGPAVWAKNRRDDFRVVAR